MPETSQIKYFLYSACGAAVPYAEHKLAPAKFEESLYQTSSVFVFFGKEFFKVRIYPVTCFSRIQSGYIIAGRRRVVRPQHGAQNIKHSILISHRETPYRVFADCQQVSGGVYLFHYTTFYYIYAIVLANFFIFFHNLTIKTIILR